MVHSPLIHVDAETREKNAGVSPDRVIWGGPIVTFRSDNSRDVDVKDFSVGEIRVQLHMRVINTLYNYLRGFLMPSSVRWLAIHNISISHLNVNYYKI
ncbi:MAG: hypothetical protein WAM42_11890 [Candidatus Nitrosopolaris sp.]